MKSYRVNTVVEKDGSIHLCGLPPHQEGEGLIPEQMGLSEEMQAWLKDIRSRHPFAKMEKAEILTLLRQTREAVWAEQQRFLRFEGQTGGFYDETNRSL